MATEFLPLRVAVLTLSDTRTISEDRSGAYLEGALLEAGHALAARSLCPDDRYVRIAVGLDYREAAPISGVRRGPGAETLEVDVTVTQPGSAQQ